MDDMHVNIESCKTHVTYLKGNNSDFVISPVSFYFPKIYSLCQEELDQRFAPGRFFREWSAPTACLE